MKIQASHLSQFLKRAGFGGSLENMQSVLLTFGSEGLEFLAGDQVTRSLISDAFLPRDLFLEYEEVGQFYIRDLKMLIGILDMIDLSKDVEIRISDRVMRIEAVGIRSDIVAAELPEDPIAIKISELLQDRVLKLKPVEVSKAILEKVVKAITLVNGMELLITSKEDHLSFVVPSSVIQEEEVTLFSELKEPVEDFTVTLAAKSFAPLIRFLPGKTTMLSVYEGVVVILDKEFFSNKQTGISTECRFSVALATLRAQA